MSKLPNSFSIKTLAHYAQAISTCTFRKYDYGPAINQMLYAQPIPPEYDLQNIRAPTYFFTAINDNYAVPNVSEFYVYTLRKISSFELISFLQDVKITAGKLLPTTLKEIIVVNSELFNHIDFLLAYDADKYVYNKILRIMKQHSNEEWDDKSSTENHKGFFPGVNINGE